MAPWVESGARGKEGSPGDLAQRNLRMGEASLDELVLVVTIPTLDLDLERKSSLEADLGWRDADREEASRVRVVIVPEWLRPPRTSSYEGGIIPTAVSSPETSRASVEGREKEGFSADFGCTD